jgi:hypothetical protein
MSPTEVRLPYPFSNYIILTKMLPFSYPSSLARPMQPGTKRPNHKGAEDSQSNMAPGLEQARGSARVRRRRQVRQGVGRNQAAQQGATCPLCRVNPWIIY